MGRSKRSVEKPVIEVASSSEEEGSGEKGCSAMVVHGSDGGFSQKHYQSDDSVSSFEEPGENEMVAAETQEVVEERISNKVDFNYVRDLGRRINIQTQAELNNRNEFLVRNVIAECEEKGQMFGSGEEFLEDEGEEKQGLGGLHCWTDEEVSDMEEGEFI